MGPLPSRSVSRPNNTASRDVGGQHGSPGVAVSRPPTPGSLLVLPRKGSRVGSPLHKPAEGGPMNRLMLIAVFAGAFLVLSRAQDRQPGTLPPGPPPGPTWGTPVLIN